nr:zinc finger protein 444 [Cavia porcellus]
MREALTSAANRKVPHAFWETKSEPWIALFAPAGANRLQAALQGILGSVVLSLRRSAGRIAKVNGKPPLPRCFLGNVVPSETAEKASCWAERGTEGAGLWEVGGRVGKTSEFGAKPAGAWSPGELCAHVRGVARGPCTPETALASSSGKLSLPAPGPMEPPAPLSVKQEEPATEGPGPGAEMPDPPALDSPSPDSPWHRFRHFQLGAAPGPREALGLLRALCRAWLRPEVRTKEQMLELLVLERFLSALPAGTRAWVCSRRPRSGDEAVALLEELWVSQGPSASPDWSTVMRAPQDATGSAGLGVGKEDLGAVPFGVVGPGVEVPAMGDARAAWPPKQEPDSPPPANPGTPGAPCPECGQTPARAQRPYGRSHTPAPSAARPSGARSTCGATASRTRKR